MIGNSWSHVPAYGRLVTSMAAVLALGACAAGDPGGNSDNPFTTNPPANETGMVVTDPGPTEPTGGTTGGPVSDSVSDSVTATNPTTGNETGPFDPTEAPDPECSDADQDKDGYGEGCMLGPDCDDNDFNNHSPDGCANCVDMDKDGVWVGCDQYGDAKPGPDCADDNPEVGASDEVELCDGIAQNCAGEIDPLPADEMCPAGGVDVPNVADMSGWLCKDVAPGEDGCEIAACDAGFYDANKTPGDGCECVGTSRATSLDACGDDPKGTLPAIAEGGVAAPMKGTIPFVDNGPGMGLEDWFVVPFPEAMAQGARPFTGTALITFAVNPGDPANPDYRFEVYRTCGGAPFEGGLATTFGAGAPPAREWSFVDTPNPGNPNPNTNYKSDVPWPEKVYIRVFRVNNTGTCGEYTLQVSRPAN